MNILITGANGFIGSYLAKQLNSKYNIIKLINGYSYSNSKNTIVCNLTDEQHIKNFLQEDMNFDIIIHAASIMVSSSNINSLSLFYDNVKMYENLLLIVEKFRPSKVINLSSIAVYPNIDGEFSEDSEIRPSLNNDGLYGLSKFCGENILDFFNKKHTICITHLRVAQVYGDGMREDRIFQMMLKELELTNSITVFGNGERMSGFIEVNILIKKIIYFIEKNICGIFNVGSQNMLYADIAKNIINEYGNLNSTIKFVDYGTSSKTLINCDKLKLEESKDGL